MKKLPLLTFLLIFIGCIGCTNTSQNPPLTQEQMDSIAKVKQDSVRLVDSIAKMERQIADSISQAKQREKSETLSKLSKKFRFNEDEFGEKTWVYHNNAPKYTNINSIHLYFQIDKNDGASNLRFRVQYEADDWLFIKNMIFNIDGENITFIPDDMETDCGNGGRIWEWCDEAASYNSELVSKIANAKTVKVKFNGRQYYDTRTMSAKELQAFKDTYEYYNALRDN